jgi:hypothetical protein
MSEFRERHVSPLDDITFRLEGIEPGFFSANSTTITLSRTSVSNPFLAAPKSKWVPHSCSSLQLHRKVFAARDETIRQMGSSALNTSHHHYNAKKLYA